MLKSEYFKPDIELLFINSQDVITSSGELDVETVNPPDDNVDWGEIK